MKGRKRNPPAAENAAWLFALPGYGAYGPTLHMLQNGSSLGEGLRVFILSPPPDSPESRRVGRWGPSGKAKKILIIPGPDLITAIMAGDSQHMIVITVARGNP